MKKIILILFLLLVILCQFFIPVVQQRKVPVNAPFLSLYSAIVSPAHWEDWRPDLKKIADEDSARIAVKKGKESFTMICAGKTLNVKFQGATFFIDDSLSGKVAKYDYTLLPHKIDSVTSVVVTKKTNIIGYLLSKAGKDIFGDTHITDLKNFWETDSLRYGCHIIKVKVPEANLIEIRKKVLEKDKFTTAAQSLKALQRFIVEKHVRQMQPVIAQFLPGGKDSTQVNVGFFINKPVNAEGDVTFVTMPPSAPLYTAKFEGEFNRRQKVYEGVRQYFRDHGYQPVILPFETYLDNKLPLSDTDKINMQVNFGSYF